MLSDYVPKSDLVVSSADLQSKQNVSDDSNIYHFNNFIKFFGIKDNKKLCWKYSTGETDFYKYSLQALELIVDEIKKDPDNILDNIKNKLTPGAKEF